MTRLHLFEDFADRCERQRAHGVAEVLEHRLLRERALGTEESDLERLLLRKARRHDLAEQPRDLLVAQRPLVALQRLAQHLRLALRLVEVGGAQPRGALRVADLLRVLGALVQQLVNAPIDVVDAVANGVKLMRSFVWVGL